jgi:hypothetical protein
MESGQPTGRMNTCSRRRTCTDNLTGEGLRISKIAEGLLRHSYSHIPPLPLTLQLKERTTVSMPTS